MEIKINLEIGLSPALEGFLAKVLGVNEAAPRKSIDIGAPAANYTGAPNVEERAEEALAAAEDPQPEAQRRTRRTKAQMEADAAAAATAEAGDQGSADDGSKTSSTATTAASLSDAVAASEAASAPTKDDLRAATSRAMARVPGCAAKLQAAWVAEFGAEQKSAGTIDPSNYGRAVEIADTIA